MCPDDSINKGFQVGACFTSCISLSAVKLSLFTLAFQNFFKMKHGGYAFCMCSHLTEMYGRQYMPIERGRINEC